MSCWILSCFSFFDCAFLGRGAAVHGGEAWLVRRAGWTRGKAIHRWLLHSRICLQTLRAPVPRCRLLSASPPVREAPGQGVRGRSMPRREASEGAGLSPPGWELCSCSPSSRERFHCVILAQPSGRAQSLRHLSMGLGCINIAGQTLAPQEPAAA